MSRLFLSHSSANNAEAIALRDWLIGHGWDDLFLDLDPDRGLKAGERWQAALKQAAERCELVIFLVSPEWAASKWCLAEFLLAKNLNKRVFGVIVEPTPLSDLPTEMTAEWQLVDLAAGKRDHKVTVTPPPGDKTETVAFAKDGLERLRIGLMQAGLDARYFVWPPEDDPERAPYRGLEPLEAEDAGIFFGRDGPTIVGLDRLRGLREAAAPRLLVILGASGAGKSSFLRAGLLPRLARESQHFLPLPVIRPERAALSSKTGLIVSLEAALKEAGLPRTRADIRKAIEASPAKVASLLQDLAKANTATHTGDGSKPSQPPTLVIAIDQAEELFHGEGAEQAKVLLDLLGTLAAEDDPALIVLFTIRSDNYEQLQTAKSLEGLRQDTFSLPPMPKGAYAEVIKGPARRLEGTSRALKIEEALIDALLADIEEGGAKDALPLLAFTLERLYREEGGDGDLKLAEYEELGRVKGSIEAAVERALTAADADPKIPRDRDARLALLRRGLIPWLAGIDPDSGSPRRRIARRSEIPTESAPLIDLLVEQHLLATDRRKISKEGEPPKYEVTIEPVHEALLRQWGLLQGWLTEDLAALSTLEGVKRAARDWAANAYAPDWLNHAGTRLEEAEQFAGREDLAGDLSADARNYLKGCREQEETKRRERLARLEAEREEQERRVKDAEALAAANKRMAQRTSIGLLAALALVVLAGWQWWEAGTARDRAEQAINLASDTANSLIFDLAQKFRDVAGVPATLVRDLLDRARALQDQLISAGEATPDIRRSQAVALQQSAQTLLTLGDTNGALAAAQQSQSIMGDLLTEDPDNLDWQRILSLSYDNAGHVLSAQGKLAEALQAYQNSLAITDRLAKADPNSFERQVDLAASYEQVGDVSVEQGNLDAALKYYRDSFSIKDRLVKAEPNNLGWQSFLTVALDRIGNVLTSQGNLDAAQTSYRDSLTIRGRLAKADPSNAGWQKDRASSFDSIGNVLFTQGKLDEALKLYRDSLAIRDRLAKADPGNTGWQSDLAYTYVNVGDVLVAQGNLDAALTSYRDSLAIRDRLAKADPSNSGWQTNLAWSFDSLGSVLTAQGKLDEALKLYRDSLAIRDRLANSDPSNAGWQQDLSGTFESIGKALVAQGQLAEALQSFQDSLVIREALVAKDATNSQWRDALGALSYHFLFVRGFAKALEIGDEAISPAPDKLWIDANRAHALMFLDRADEARALYLKYRGRNNVVGQKPWEVIVLDDFAQLRKAGLVHPLMDEIEQELAAALKSATGIPSPASMVSGGNPAQ